MKNLNSKSKDTDIASINMENHWMPFSDNRDFKAKPRIMMQAKGIYYINQNGDKVMDASSGLFTTPLGHCREEITEAVTKQLQKLDFTPHFNTGHEVSFKAAERISRLLPDKLNRIFFVNSGSETVDSTIKMIYAYWRAKGQGQKNILISRERAYHGVNMGGVALSGILNNRSSFNSITPLVAHMRHTCLPENRFTRGLPEKGADLAEDLQRLIDLHGAENIAACFVEPVAGGIGCLVPPQGYLKRLREICTKNDILLVFDEVICGFARTGEWFASQTFNIEPDIITMAKAIANGAIPLGAVAAKQEIYDTIVNAADEKMIEFFHGYTYSAHPVACAACIAAMDIMINEEMDKRAKKLAKVLEDALFQLQGISVVQDIRNCGMLAAIELVPKDKPSLRGTEVYQNLFWSGLHLKGTGDNLIIAPPYIMEEDDIDKMYQMLRDELKKY